MSIDTEQFTSPVDTAPANEENKGPFTSPDSDTQLDQSGREIKKAPSFSGALEKSAKKNENDKEERESKAEKREDKKSTDPIAAKAAEEKKEETKSRSSRLLADDDKEEKPAKAEKKDDKKEKKESTVTDDEIEQELDAPHTEKSKNRFHELHGRWKAAEAKAATTAKAIAEKDKRLAELETQMKEQASKGASDPEIQKKLDQLEMYQRRFDLEGSDHVKNTFDARISRSEDSIYSTLQSAGIKFKGMDEKQSVEFIKKQGGFRGFARAFPEVAENMLDALPLIDKKSLEAAVTSQIQLEQEKTHYITTESSKAKEYFEAQRKEAETAKASQVTPEKRKELQAAAIKKLADDMYGKYPFFKEAEVPSDASSEERERLTSDNTFAKEMRETLASHLQPANDDEFIDTALAATLAHKFKRDNVSLRKEVKQLQSDLERLKNGSRTGGRGGALPATTPDKSTQKPAASFDAALNRAADRRGGNL